MVAAPPSGAAFAFLTPVEALWKQEGKKSFAIKRIAGTTRKFSNQTALLHKSREGFIL